MLKTFFDYCFSIFFVILCATTFALASPEIETISGMVNDGETITVKSTDSNFGTGPTVLKWDNFENGVDGQVVTNGWSTPMTDPHYNNDCQRTGSTLSAYADNATDDLEWEHSGTWSQGYITFWFRTDYTGLCGSPNTKWFMLWSESYSDRNPDICFIQQWSASGAMANNYWDNLTYNPKNWYYGNAMDDETWERVEVYFEESSAPGGIFNGTADGTLQMWRQDGGEGNTFNQHINDTSVQTNSNNGTRHIKACAFMTYNAGSECPQNQRVDDVYISDSKARVEIGDKATLASCTHREIQIPIDWSSSLITFTINQGSFSNGETAYVFIVDADGYASSGKEITIGETAMPGAADITPPQDIIDFTATPGDSWISLSWTNPNDDDFVGVMIRYRTDGSYPQNYQDGELACDIVGNPGEAGSYVLEGVENGVTCYFSAFSYDEVPNYTQTVHATATPTADELISDYAPVPINSSALPGLVDPHSNSGGRRIVRINNTTIVIAPHGLGERTYRSTNNGSSWSEIDTDGAFSGCLITGPDEMVYHFYRSGDNIYMVQFKYNEIPSSPVTIYQNANVSETDTFVYAAVNATVDAFGTLYVVTHWGHPDQLYLIRSTDGGNTWTGPFQISSGSVVYYYPHLEVTANNLLVCAYEEGPSGEIWLAKSLDQGETWSRVLVSDENTVNPSVLTVGTDTIYIFAQSSEFAHQGLVYNKSTDQGNSWSGWDLIDTTCGYADPSPGLGSDGNTIYVAYRSSNGTGITDGTCGEQSRSRLAMSPDLGQTWNFIDNNYAAERTGARNQIRYQTFWNYGGPLEWIWMQYENGGTNRPIYYDIKTDTNIFVTTVSVGEGVPAAPTSLRITEE